MAKQTINLGTGELTGDGESIRSAFDKINSNFDELYTQDSNDIVLSAINAHIIPDTNVAYDLGSATNRFRDLYLSGSTIDLGGTTLSVVGGELQLSGVKVPTTADVAATVASAVSAPSGDLTGSVFADNSTMLVDGVAGKIVGPIEAPSILSSSYVQASSVNADLYGANTIGNFINFGTNASSINVVTDINMLTFSITNATTISATTFAGNLTSEDGSDLELSSTNDININTSTGNENHTFEFKGDGTFYMAKNSVSDTSYISTPRNDNTASLTLTSATDLNIETNEGVGSIETWTFGADGTLDFPDGTTQSTAWTGNALGFTYNDVGGTSEISVTADTFDFGDGKTIDMQNSSVLFNDSNIQDFAPGAIYAKNGQVLYVVSKRDGGTTTNVTFTYDTNISNVRQTFYGKTQFGNNGQVPVVDFTGATVTNWTDPNVVNTHNGSAWIVVGGQTATIDNLTVRIANDGLNQIKVQFNYNPNGTAGVSASGDAENQIGVASFAPGNTDWFTVNLITTAGTTKTFTVTDHGYHKVYRGTVVSRNMPDGGPTPGDAYCVIERLK